MSTVGKVLEIVGYFIVLPWEVLQLSVFDSPLARIERPKREVAATFLIAIAVGLVIVCIGSMMRGPFQPPFQAMLVGLLLISLSWISAQRRL